MKKYFCKETDEMIDYGDVLYLTFRKDIKEGKVTVEKQVPFTAESKDLLMHLGFVEEREVDEDNNDLLDFDEKQCEALDELVEDFEALEQRVDRLEENIEKLKSMEGLVKTIRADILNIQKALKKQQ